MRFKTRIILDELDKETAEGHASRAAALCYANAIEYSDPEMAGSVRTLVRRCLNRLDPKFKGHLDCTSLHTPDSDKRKHALCPTCMLPLKVKSVAPDAHGGCLLVHTQDIFVCAKCDHKMNGRAWKLLHIRKVT